MKWCNRVGSICEQQQVLDRTILPLNTREDILTEAFDCFIASIPHSEAKEQFTYGMAEIWDVSSDRIESYMSLYKPRLESRDASLSIGRVTLRKLRESAPAVISASNFAFTRHALRLMEQVAVCIHLNEPALLIGETGTGKTSVIQYMSNQLNQQLVVLVCLLSTFGY